MIRLDQVTKTYANGVAAVRDLTLEVARGEILVLLGRSGCGKSTTLRLINRMLEWDSGNILIDGKDTRDSDPVLLRRGIGTVIQEGGLFPHWTVAENIATVPRLLGWDPGRIRREVDAVLDRMRLPRDMRNRYPGRLSGGQKQRVGIARALVADPSVLLMDEPFGALDPLTREVLQSDLLGLQRELAKTVVLVTHDLSEADRLGDRIALMDAGRLIQCGSGEELRNRPSNGFVREFFAASAGGPHG